MNIRNRFLTGFLSILVILLAAGLWSLRQLEDELEASAGESFVAVARSTLDRLEQEIYARVEQIEILARTTPELEQLLERSNDELAALGSEAEIARTIAERDAVWQSWRRDAGETPPELVRAVSEHPVSTLLLRKQAFFRQLRGHQVFAEIFVTGRHGANVAQTAPTSDYRQDDEAWWQGGRRDGVWLSAVDFDQSTGVYSIDFALRVDDQEGSFLGVLKAVLDVAEIADLLAVYAAGVKLDNGTVELVDARGARLYPSFLPPTESRQTAEPFAEFRRETNPETGEQLRLEVGTAGHPRYPDLGWRLRASYPVATVFAPIAELRRRLMLAVLLAVLAAGGVAIFVARQVAAPLADAVAVADRLARGDLEVEITARGGGEATALLAAMSAMTGNIQRIIGQLVASARHTAAAARHLSETAHQIDAGAARQIRATGDSRASVDAMNASTEQVSRSLGEVAIEVEATSAAIATMARSIATVATNAERQAATLEETFARAHQMSASVQGVADDAAHVGNATSAAVEEARAGATAVRETAAGMEQLARAIDEIVTVNDRLAEKSRRISRITEVIEGIAGQSGMLALNAAIQATKAGDRGHGFAVVAEEIGSLAERSASSAQEIARLVEDLQAETGAATESSALGARRAREGVALAARAATALERIESTVSVVRETMEEIAARTREQTSTAEAMRESFEHMHRMTGEVTAETRTLRQDRERIQGVVQRLQSVTQEAAPAIERHHGDSQRVGSAIERIAAISAQNAQTAQEIVTATEQLEAEAKALRDIAGFFRARAE